MPIPTYEELMLPLLSLLADGKQHQFANLVPTLETRFDLSESERTELLPSGRVSKFRSRLHWAATYMAASGLVDRPQRGWLQVTPRGIAVLNEKPTKIDNSFLNRYPEFRAFRERSRKKPKDSAAGSDTTALWPTDSQLSPEEALETSYLAIRQQLAEELLTKLQEGSPQFFEKVVVDLLVAMGYGGSKPSVAKAVGRSGDEGIDGVINEDKLGLDVVYIQAKRWSSSVGSPVVHQFTGSLEGKKANKGVLITTSTFTKEARDFVNLIGKRVVLIDGETLADFMIDYDVGVTTASTFVVKRVDNDYFEE